jgi:hypothetical protein
MRQSCITLAYVNCEIKTTCHEHWHMEESTWQEREVTITQARTHMLARDMWLRARSSSQQGLAAYNNNAVLCGLVPNPTKLDHPPVSTLFSQRHEMMMMKASASFLPSLPPRTYGAPPPSMSAARSKTSSAARSSSKVLSDSPH